MWMRLASNDECWHCVCVLVKDIIEGSLCGWWWSDAKQRRQQQKKRDTEAAGYRWASCCTTATTRYTAPVKKSGFLRHHAHPKTTTTRTSTESLDDMEKNPKNNISSLKIVWVFVLWLGITTKHLVFTYFQSAACLICHLRVSVWWWWGNENYLATVMGRLRSVCKETNAHS